MSRGSGHSWSARTKAQSHAREAVDGGVAPVNDFLLHPTTCMDIATTTVHNLLIVRHEPIKLKSDNLQYTRYAREAIKAVDGGVAPENDFLLHPTTCLDIATTTVHNLLIVWHEPLLVETIDISQSSI